MSVVIYTFDGAFSSSALGAVLPHEQQAVATKSVAAKKLKIFIIAC
jgi:hypothetical protein